MAKFSARIGVKSASVYYYYEKKGRIPKGSVLETMSKSLGMTPQELLGGVSPMATPNVSSTPIPLSEMGFRKVPVVSWAKAGTALNYDDLCTHLEEYALTQTTDPNSFALIIEGDSMEPEIMAGDTAVFAPNSEPRNGDLVVARYHADGGVVFKRFYRTGKEGKTIRLVSTNPNYEDILKDQSEFRFIYPCVNLVRNYRRK